MKIPSLMLVLGLLMLPFGDAQEITIDGPGVTPDSLWWFFDVLSERITLFFTLGKENKVAESLHIAGERVLEMGEMIETGNFAASERARDEHAHIFARIQRYVSIFEDQDTSIKLQTLIRWHRRLQEYENSIEPVLSHESSVSLVNRLHQDVEETKTKVGEKKKETVVALQAQLGKSDEEISQFVKELEARIS